MEYISMHILFLWTYNQDSFTDKFLLDIYCILLYWYYILCDSIIAWVITYKYRTLPQIVLFQQNYFQEFDCISTYIADTIYAAQNFHNPSVTVSTLHAYDTLIENRDQQFLDREELCRSFINPSFTFYIYICLYIWPLRWYFEFVSTDSPSHSFVSICIEEHHFVQLPPFCFTRSEGKIF